MVFKSKTDKFHLFSLYTLLTGLSLILLLSWIEKSVDTNYKIGLTFLILTLSFALIWVFNSISYTLINNEIHFSAGPFRKKTSIHSICSLTIGKKYEFGAHYFATAGKGIIIQHNATNKVYISPESIDIFIKELSRINPKIQIIEPKEID